MSEEDVRRFELEQKQLKQDYKAMEGPGLKDLMAWLESNHKSAMQSAEVELDNSHKRSCYLQSAIVYHKVKLHLDAMLGE